HDNPFDVGDGPARFRVGVSGDGVVRRRAHARDRLPVPAVLPDHAVKIQVDLRGENLGRRTPLDIGLVGDVADTAEALLPLTATEPRAPRELPRSLREDTTPSRRSGHAVWLRAGRFIRSTWPGSSTDRRRDGVHPDVGSPVVWAARYLTMNGRRRLIGSFSHGSMANALPQAIGVQATERTRQVVALAGDGGLAMMLGELLTLEQNAPLPVKIVVFNNSSLNFVELEMKAAGFVNSGTGLTNPNFAALAEAIGIRGVRVTESADLEEALRDTFSHDGPALIEVVTDRQELSMPPSITAEQMKGFTLYALRTVLSGRATRSSTWPRPTCDRFCSAVTAGELMHRVRVTGRVQGVVPGELP
ncbi:Pyruvate dehydrogenase, partial [Eumeta japonica]